MNVASITTQQFDSQVLDSNVPVLVDFYADWCPPCRALAPELQTLAAQLGDSARVVKIHIEREPQLAQRYEIASIPTLLVFRNGQIVQRHSGYANAQQLHKMLNASDQPASAR